MHRTYMVLANPARCVYSTSRTALPPSPPPRTSGETRARGCCLATANEALHDAIYVIDCRPGFNARPETHAWGCYGPATANKALHDAEYVINCRPGFNARPETHAQRSCPATASQTHSIERPVPPHAGLNAPGVSAFTDALSRNTTLRLLDLSANPQLASPACVSALVGMVSAISARRTCNTQVCVWVWVRSPAESALPLSVPLQAHSCFKVFSSFKVFNSCLKSNSPH
jgi:hypothetical protein